ncbi:MAG TPA: hypothetical protein VFK02_15295 [Kofleriaceae bacterium]|nr:hypothetical protein [Kofleriaceae bacterium]
MPSPTQVSTPDGAWNAGPVAGITLAAVHDPANLCVLRTAIEKVQ